MAEIVCEGDHVVGVKFGQPDHLLVRIGGTTVEAVLKAPEGIITPHARAFRYK